MIQPGLCVDVVLEPAIGATNSHVEDEIEVLVKGSLIAASVFPDIMDTSSVGIRGGEVAALPERLVEVGVEDLKEAGVDVGEEIFLRPLQSESVEASRVRSMESSALDVGAPPGIVGRARAPVKRRRDDVVAALGVSVVVTAGLDDIDLARRWPGSVSVLDGHHPDGGPEPVALRQLGSHLDAAILDARARLGVDAPR